MNIRKFETELTIKKYKETQDQFEKRIWNPYVGKRWLQIKEDVNLDPAASEENKIRWEKGTSPILREAQVVVRQFSNVPRLRWRNRGLWRGGASLL